MSQSPKDLAVRIVDPGFTPPLRALGPLLELIGGDEDLATHVERAVLRIEAQYAAKVAAATVDRARAAERPARGRLTRVAGRLARSDRDPDGAARGWLIEALADADPKTRRVAARALGGLPATPEIARALE